MKKERLFLVCVTGLTPPMVGHFFITLDKGKKLTKELIVEELAFFEKNNNLPEAPIITFLKEIT